MGVHGRWLLLLSVGTLFALGAARADAAYLIVGDHWNGFGQPVDPHYVGATGPFARTSCDQITGGSCTVVNQVSSGRYQQVYRSSEFLSVPGALTITQLTFRPSREGGRFDVVVPNVTIRLSTTSVEPLFLTTDFDGNLGLDATVVFHGDLHLTSNAVPVCPSWDPNSMYCTREFDVVVTLQTPFRYDPQAGNLLLEVLYPSGSASGTMGCPSTAGCYYSYEFWHGQATDLEPTHYITASAWSDTGSTGAGLSGLVTRFTYDLAAPQSPIVSFVYDLYSHALGRNPDAGGLTDWETYLGSHCNASGFTVSADAFFDSLEFRTTRRETMAELVSDLYRALLNREPDAAGLATWSANLKQARLDVAINGFIPSAEFQVTVPNRADRTAVTALVSRFYSEVLGRTPDDPGLQGWVNYVVASGDVNGTALAFLASAEFDAHRLTFRDYVTVLYRAFFGRAPDAAGLDAWEQVLRAHLVAVINQGFIPSPEFQAHVGQDCH